MGLISISGIKLPVIASKLPVTNNSSNYPFICSACSYVNPLYHDFCTNCGFPKTPDDLKLKVYRLRIRDRKLLKVKCTRQVSQARNSLYFIAATGMLGFFYLFSGWRSLMIRGTIMILLGLVYASLGLWSLKKPFTSLLISLMIMLTFIAINTWAEFASSAASSGIGFLIVLQLVLVYFLLQGVKGAFHADILEEESKY